MNLTGQSVRPKLGRPEERKKDNTPRAKKQRQPRIMIKAYKAMIATLPSLISGEGPCEVCHVRYADAVHLKRETGMGEKPTDIYCVPLKRTEHREGKNAQHSTNERMWWEEQRIDPLQVCKDLYTAYTTNEESRRRDEMVKVIAAHRFLGQTRRKETA